MDRGVYEGAYTPGQDKDVCGTCVNLVGFQNISTLAGGYIFRSR